MWFIAKKILGLVAKPIADYFTKREERKTAEDAIHGKIALAKANKESKLELADHELRVLRTKDAGGSWKDEFVTLLVSVPIIIAMAGALVMVVEPVVGERLLEAAKHITAIMTGDTIDYAELWLIVVATALGTKPFRK